MSVTPIQWTDRSINPLVAVVCGPDDKDYIGHHCVKVSPGCKHCYASRMQPRFGLPRFEEVQRRENIVFDKCCLMPERLMEVARRRKPTKWFWCDMTDMFGDWVPDLHLDHCFAVMAQTPQHTHQLLTKRPARMRDYMNGMAALSPTERTLRLVRGMYHGHPAEGLTKLVREGVGELDWPLPNVWLGTSTENQETARERIPLLMDTPAAVRFLSCEPLLGPIDFTGIGKQFCVQAIQKRSGKPTLDWIIVGGESGPRSRPCDLEWIRSIVRQCREGGVAPFVKQLGRWIVAPAEMSRSECARVNQWLFDEGSRWTPGVIGEHNYQRPARAVAYNLGDSHGGNMDEWPEDLRVREFPK